jgi:ethanolamine-phosphate cytidylyltransferase
LEDFDC